MIHKMECVLLLKIEKILNQNNYGNYYSSIMIDDGLETHCWELGSLEIEIMH